MRAIMDNKRRVTIPIEFIEQMGWKPGDKLQIDARGQSLTIYKTVSEEKAVTKMLIKLANGK
jgi:bifunctional DNA-binding transcriptional regulator/antitoxin component of YhaV-PrlF toxin-antitoxin module